MKSKQIKSSTKVKFTYSTKDISDCNIYIVCVPTPINKQKKPDLKSIISATILVSKVLSRNDIVV